MSNAHFTASEDAVAVRYPIGPAVDLRRLRQFVILAETGNVSRAAESLNMAQPALSISIRKLEGELGVALFVREPRGVSLTPSGRAALSEARLTLFHADAFAQIAVGAALGTRGRLRLSFVASATYGLLQRLVPPFRNDYADVTLVLSEATSSTTILTALEEDRLDVGIVRTPLLASANVDLVELESDVFILALPREHPLAGRMSAPLEAVRGDLFVMYDLVLAPGIRSAAMLACQQAGFYPRIGQEALQVPTILSMVESGLGVALVPSVMRRYKSDLIAYCELENPPPAARISLSLATVKSPATPATKSFVASATKLASAKHLG